MKNEAAPAFEMQAWKDALGLSRSGTRDMSPGKSAQAARVADAVARLTLPQEHIDRVAELRREFARVGDAELKIVGRHGATSWDAVVVIGGISPQS